MMELCIFNLLACVLNTHFVLYTITPFPIFPFTLPHFFLVPPYLPQIYEILQIQFVNRI